MNLSDHKKEISDNGYTILKNILNKNDCIFFKNLLEETYVKYSNKYAKDGENNQLSDKSGEKVVYNLHNKNLAWFKLFEHNKIISIVSSLLKEGSYKNEEPIYLYNISARTPKKGSGRQQIHIDGGIPGLRVPLFINVMWYLDDVHKMNGPTVVVPGSHKKKSFCPDNVVPKNAKKLYLKKGDVVIFDGSLWHGGTNSLSEDSRWALILGYTRWFIKPSFDYAKNTPKELWLKMTEKQKQLLGFNLMPPKDEFTRSRRRTNLSEEPLSYELPD